MSSLLENCSRIYCVVSTHSNYWQCCAQIFLYFFWFLRILLFLSLNVTSAKKHNLLPGTWHTCKVCATIDIRKIITQKKVIRFTFTRHFFRIWKLPKKVPCIIVHKNHIVHRKYFDKFLTGIKTWVLFKITFWRFKNEKKSLRKSNIFDVLPNFIQ